MTGSVALVTLGCKLNFVEMEELAWLFAREGWRVVPFGTPADVTVVHTCTVTSRSDFKSRHLVRRAHRISPQGRLVVTGCYAELDGQTLGSLPGVSMVVSRSQLFQLPSLLGASQTHPPSPATIVRPATRLSRAFIKVQWGCDQRCTFCRVWQARGPSTSVPLDVIVAQAQTFLAQGFQELVLTGVDMGSWGKDLGLGRSLATLLQRLVDLPGNFRVRLSSLYPGDIDDHIFELVTSHPKVCRHLHLPVQSASTQVLRRMGRHVDPEALLALTWRLRHAAGRFGIGADLIAGFPGESEADFQATVRFVESSALTYLHVFPFSPRPGTHAASFPGLPQALVEQRAAILRELGARKRAAYRASHPGGPVEVLAERRRHRCGLLTGFTTDYLRVWFAGPDEWMGKLVSPTLPPGLGPCPGEEDPLQAP